MGGASVLAWALGPQTTGQILWFIHIWWPGAQGSQVSGMGPLLGRRLAGCGPLGVIFWST